MLDMGFGPDIKKIIEMFGMPPKTERQTLMFSATFPEEIQRLAAEYLNDYLFLAIGNVGGANTDVSQFVFEVDRLAKREKLVEILTESGTFLFYTTAFAISSLTPPSKKRYCFAHVGLSVGNLFVSVQ